MAMGGVRYGSKDPWERYRKAIEPESTVPAEPAPAPPSAPRSTTYKPGKMYNLFDIMDEETKKKRLLDNALRGSKTFTKAELKQGYRKVK
jgi:hypothetical protein